MKNKIIICGIAPHLENDLKNIFKTMELDNFDFIAVGLNCSDRIKFDIQHAVSYHPKEFVEFKNRRERIGGNLDFTTHSHISPCDRMWPLVAPHPYSGSSSFLAAQVATGLRYQKIILCGCPLQGSNLHSPQKSQYEIFQKGWTKHAARIFGKDKVRSMSGWTKDFLGEPTIEWLNS